MHPCTRGSLLLASPRHGWTAPPRTKGPGTRGAPRPTRQHRPRQAHAAPSSPARPLVTNGRRKADELSSKAAELVPRAHGLRRPTSAWPSLARRRAPARARRCFWLRCTRSDGARSCAAKPSGLGAASRAGTRPPVSSPSCGRSDRPTDRRGAGPAQAPPPGTTSSEAIERLPANRGISCAAPAKPCRVSFIPELDGGARQNATCHGPRPSPAPAPPRQPPRCRGSSRRFARAAATWRPPLSGAGALGRGRARALPRRPARQAALVTGRGRVRQGHDAASHWRAACLPSSRLARRAPGRPGAARHAPHLTLAPIMACSLLDAFEDVGPRRRRADEAQSRQHSRRGLPVWHQS